MTPVPFFPVRTDLQCRGRLTCECLQFHLVIINSTADTFRPNISGDIYLSLFLTHIVFCQKNNYFGPYILICRTIIHYKRGLYHGYGARAGNVPPSVRITLHGEWTHARRRPYGPVYISLPGPRLRLTRPRRFTTPWPSDVADPPVSDFNFT